VHGHWIKDGLKMSKSIGNIVEPCDLLSKFDINPLRLYFLGKGPLHRDMEFNEE
jgi:methionyl-tRNA synthetase